jgi:large subunit ribosomal protein L19
MITEIVNKFERKYNKKSVPNLSVGDTVSVHTIIRDGDKTRIQRFNGIVIAMSGKGMSKTFTVRKISYGIGVEKIFPLYSTNIDKIEILKHAKVRRAKLYFLRDRIGKRAMKLKKGDEVEPDENKVNTLKKEETEKTNNSTEEVKEATQ